LTKAGGGEKRKSWGENKRKGGTGNVFQVKKISCSLHQETTITRKAKQTRGGKIKKKP